MSDKIPVFDSWGNKIGDYIPNGGSDNFIVMLVLLALGLLIWGAVSLVKFISKGFKALAEHKWRMSVIHLSPIWVTVAIVLIACGVGKISEINQQAQEANIRAKIQELNQNPPVDVKMWKGKCLEPTIYDCGGWGYETTYLFAEVTNHWSGTIGVTLDGTQCDVIPWDISPGQTVRISCVGSEDVDLMSKGCASFVFRVSSSDPMYLHEPTPTVCRDLK